MSALWIAYCPTLRSPGGLTAATHLYAQATQSAAPPDVFVGPVLPPSWDGSVQLREVSGHWAAMKAVDALCADRPVHVVTLQNPALIRRRWKASSVVQNHAALHLFLAISRARTPREMFRYVGLTAGSLVQLVQSGRWHSLNTDVPWLFARLGRYAGALTNRAAADGDEQVVNALVGQPSASSVSVAWVGSFDGFRRPDLFLDACEHLPPAGHIVMVARSSDSGVRRAIVRRVERLRSGGRNIDLHIDVDRERSLAVMRRAAATVFTSTIEGSPIAFVEACLLSPVVIAIDRVHYHESVPQDARAEVQFIDERYVDDFRRALLAARGHQP